MQALKLKFLIASDSIHPASTPGFSGLPVQGFDLTKRFWVFIFKSGKRRGLTV
jgi:hypothetical protein